MKLKNRKILYFVGVGIVALVGIGVLVTLNMKQAVNDTDVSSVAPTFHFDQSAAPGWWNTENYNNQASSDDDSLGSEVTQKLPVARMSIFKGAKGDGATACFVMYAYYNYAADLDVLRGNNKEVNTAGTNVQQLEDAELSIDTPDGKVSYTLHQYALSGPDRKNSMNGTSYGFVDLNDGYIQISGVCPTGDDLSDAMSVMSAVSLVKE